MVLHERAVDADQGEPGRERLAQDRALPVGAVGHDQERGTIDGVAPVADGDDVEPRLEHPAGRLAAALCDSDGVRPADGDRRRRPASRTAAIASSASA